MVKYRAHLVLVLSLLFGQGAFGQNNPFSEAALGFDPGELRVIHAPNQEAIRPLVIATFRGLPRLGLHNDYKNPHDQSAEAQKTRIKRKELADRMRESQDMFRQLTTINLYQETIDLESWKNQFDPTDHVVNQTAITVNFKFAGPYWLSVFRLLAVKTTKPETYKKYFCKSDEDCKHLDRTSSIGPQIYHPKSERWGGIGSSEFEKKRKVIDFTDKLAPIYLKWAQDFKLTEAYVVGRVNLGEYDFKAEGFPLARMSPVGQAFVMPMTYDADAHTLLKYDYPVGSKRPSAILLKMSAEKAEAFSEDLKKKSPTGRGKELFFVYKINIKIKEKKDTKTDYGFTRPEFSYEQVPANQKIEFFSDIYLKDKVHEITR